MEKPFPAYKGNEPYVFVCYAHRDAEVVYPEFDRLHKQGINIWYDEGISAGREWTQKLADAIRGCAQFLYYISPASVESRHCRNEVQYALEHNKLLVSVYLEPTDLPGGLQLSIGITQALMRYEMHPDDYHEKLHSTLSGADTVLVSPMEPGPSRIRSVLHRISKPAIGVVFVAVLVFIGTTAVRFTERQENIRWAKEEALPQIEHLIETGWRDFTDAYALGIEAQRYIPDDPRLEQLLAMSSRPMDVTTDPPGARVYMKKYSEPDGEWSYLGVTPIEGRWVPMGIFRWKLQKNGYEVVMAAASSWAAGKGSPGHVSRTLDEQGSVPQGMIRVAGADTPVGALGDFFIDRFEVTNAQFKEFVGAGGY